ncbi:MAG: hypothetical protein M3Q67_02600 [Actinomycetota bacterium]|nr:hypothetical protein [Actinomycetota bacterium]
MRSPRGRRTIAPAAIACRARSGELVHRPPENGDARLDERVEALATCIAEIAERVRATELATGDEKTAKALRRALEAAAKHDPKLESRLTDRIDVLMDRLGTLASAVSTTSAELARRDGELAALRRDLAHGSARVDVLAKDVDQAARVVDVEKLRQAIAERPTEPPARSGAERLDRFEGKVALLAERIDTLSPTVAAAASGLAARDGELANLRQKIERSAAEVEQVIVEVRANPHIATLATRLDALGNELEATTRQLEQKDGDVEALRGRIDDGYARASAVIAELQLSLATVGSRIGAIEKVPDLVEHALAGQAAEFDTRLKTLSETVSATVGKVVELEAASAAKDSTGDETDRALTELAERIDTLSGELAAATTAVAGRESEVPALRARIDDAYAKASAVISELQLSLAALLSRVGALEVLPERLEEQLQGRDGDFDTRLTLLEAASSERTELLDDFGIRLALAEQRRQAPAEEIDRILDTWASDRSSLETRLDEIAASLIGTGSAHGIANESDADVIRLRVLVDGLQTRLSASEEEVAALRSAPDFSSRFDEITDRLVAIERGTHGVFSRRTDRSPGTAVFGSSFAPSSSASNRRRRARSRDATLSSSSSNEWRRASSGAFNSSSPRTLIARTTTRHRPGRRSSRFESAEV